jgi:D-tyrosyl-tRNA(Tyr) deacylase
MKFLIQRVLNAQVDIEGQTVGKIGKGYMILIGVGEDDTREIADRLIHKMLALRIFADENGKTNLSIKDVGGELLLV